MIYRNLTQKAGLLLIIALLAAAVGGCGETRYDVTTYEYPNWTPEGLIYYRTVTTHYVKKLGGLGSYITDILGTDVAYWTMTIEGTQETALPYTNYPYFSPIGTYAAFINGNTISIVRRSDNTEVYNFSPTAENISTLDWGPDEQQIVYLLPSKNMYLINITGNGNTRIASSIECVAWKFGNRISSIGVFDSDWGGRIFDATTRDELLNNSNMKGGELSVSAVNSNEVVYRGDSINRIDITTATASPEILINRNDLWNIHLSPDGQKIVAHGNNIYGQEIWIVDINGSNLKQFK